MNLVFASKAPKTCRVALEEMLFLNPAQHRVREGILHSLERFGHPRVEENGEGLSVRVGEQEAQTLFAFDPEGHGSDPVGVVVFLRTSPQEIAVLHVAVHPDFALQGRRAGLGLGVALVEKVKEIAARVVGVQRIVFFYRQEVVMRV